jgi:hypothetical protein
VQLTETLQVMFYVLYMNFFRTPGSVDPNPQESDHTKIISSLILTTVYYDAYKATKRFLKITGIMEKVP